MVINQCLDIEPNSQCLDKMSYLCSETLKRFRHHRHRDDYRSPAHARSVSRSPPHDDRDHKRSSSRSPRHSRDLRHRDDYHSPVHSRSVSRSPRRGDRDYSRSPSPRENGRSPANKRGHTQSRSRSPHGKACSPSGSRSQSYSPHGCR